MDRVSDDEVHRLWELRQNGASLSELAKERKTTAENISALFKSRGLPSGITKKCELPECGKIYQARMITQRACCRKHMKLLSSREDRGSLSSLLPCALPECPDYVWMVHQETKPDLKVGETSGSGKRFCCTDHADLHYRRRANGMYLRILNKGPSCIVFECNERICLDEHHIEHGPNCSNKQSKTVWLCPTHHMYVHRGLAKISPEGEFVSMIPLITKGIVDKIDMFIGYERSLGVGV